MESNTLLHTSSSGAAPRRATAVVGIGIAFAIVFAVASFHDYSIVPAWPTHPPSHDFSGDLRARCSELFFEQTLNHFEAVHERYSQRYFVCDEFYPLTRRADAPIFFYVGNEANVELYLNHTGLMWETAAEFGALLVFAEHRFFGQSMPPDARRRLQHLSSEQALADYAVLLRAIKADYGVPTAPVIGFGGSYGGMLGTWFRLKYPHVIDGMVAGSAPVLSFLGDTPPANLTAYSQIVTFDASVAGGAAPHCVANIRRSWAIMFDAARTAQGREMLQTSLGLCDPLATEAAALEIPAWLKSAYEYMAMGNYPYPSSYIMNGVSTLPAYPMRVACEPLAATFPATADGNASLLHAMRASVGVYYNSTHDARCFARAAPSNESQLVADFWDYLFCSELYQPQDQGVDDMFWLDLHNDTAAAAACEAQWNVTLRPLWANTVYGGHAALRASSNIVFTNGNLDPWSGMGVLDDVNPTVVAITVEGGAHHLDLMFSHPL
ncbi:hypothetical protein As57867_019115, partial [Aphanomyces stellatus]